MTIEPNLAVSTTTSRFEVKEVRWSFPRAYATLESLLSVQMYSFHPLQSQKPLGFVATCSPDVAVAVED